METPTEDAEELNVTHSQSLNMAKLLKPEIKESDITEETQEGPKSKSATKPDDVSLTREQSKSKNDQEIFENQPIEVNIEEDGLIAQKPVLLPGLCFELQVFVGSLENFVSEMF